MEQEGHDSLPFHPDCPQCRIQRSAGTLQEPVLLTPRLRASLAAAVLAGSTVAAPAVAVAKAPKERAPAPHAGAAQEDEVDTGIDLEVETPDVLPNEDVADDGEAQGVVPEDEAGTDDVPVEEDVIGEDPPDDGADLMEDQAETLDPPQAPAPAPAPEPEPVAQDDAVEPFALAERGSPRAAAKQARALTFVATQAAERDSGTATESGMAMDTAAAPPAAQLAASASQPAAGDAGPTGTGAFHVVQPGETLWSIARDLLGPNASTAEIAREVDRLWRLNAKTIGTGDPNLIHTGMKLRIR